ncbi:MAG: hypothetical protein LBH52_04010 [Puniceicoccales bacterium]|jgi:hypothetical protein|nr:hypothetical protein [Puniceicoccales bacterium]
MKWGDHENLASCFDTVRSYCLLHCLYALVPKDWGEIGLAIHRHGLQNGTKFQKYSGLRQIFQRLGWRGDAFDGRFFENYKIS